MHILSKNDIPPGTFYFKQFKIEDDRSTMKVGTDAILLASVVNTDDAAEILEIGTGCGVISLILAQRTQAHIEAIDIDEDSVAQALENAKKSRWKDRIKIINCALQQYTVQTRKKYDLIVSNPPYFSHSLKSEDRKRNISRHNDSLSFTELLNGISLLMKPEGSCWVILSAKETAEFIITAIKYGLHVHTLLKIFPKTGKPCHRVIFQFKKFIKKNVEENLLIINNEDGSYTKTFINLTRELYLEH